MGVGANTESCRISKDHGGMIFPGNHDKPQTDLLEQRPFVSLLKTIIGTFKTSQMKEKLKCPSFFVFLKNKKASVVLNNRSFLLLNSV